MEHIAYVYNDWRFISPNLRNAAPKTAAGFNPKSAVGDLTAELVPDDVAAELARSDLSLMQLDLPRASRWRHSGNRSAESTAGTIFWFDAKTPSTWKGTSLGGSPISLAQLIAARAF